MKKTWVEVVATVLIYLVVIIIALAIGIGIDYVIMLAYNASLHRVFGWPRLNLVQTICIIMLGATIGGWFRGQAGKS